MKQKTINYSRHFAGSLASIKFYGSSSSYANVKKKMDTLFLGIPHVVPCGVCGFLAENQREHFIEHERERQYIRSLVSDVANDTANINGIIKAFNIIPKTCDLMPLTNIVSILPSR